MTSAFGEEHVLEQTGSRTTSLIVRKVPNAILLIQKTASGIATMELSDAARTALVSVLAPPPAGGMHLTSAAEVNGASNLFNAMQTFASKIADVNAEPKRRGRPPKSEAA